MKSNTSQETVFLRGKEERAEYKEQINPTYKGNMLIEALPPLRDEEQFVEFAQTFPEYDPSYRTLPRRHRKSMTSTVFDVFQPLSMHIDLEESISDVIRDGYRYRPRERTDYWQRVDKQLGQMPNGANSRTNALSFTILGISGIGKSLAIQIILSDYPQKIIHTHYKDQAQTFIQLVWLKLDCPHDGSIKGLLLNFFHTIDEILGTNYYRTHAKSGRATVDQMIPSVAILAYVHSIGVLVIDEIQRLNEAKSGGAQKMLNFFTQLINVANMPIILVGTPRARRIVSADFSQARRGAGRGQVAWNNMDEDEEWEVFARAIWRYQYTKNESPLTPEILHRLYYESVGIADIAVKLYVMAQKRAINTEIEMITEDIITSVARDSLTEMQPMLEALRSKDYQALLEFEDIQPIVYDSELDPTFHENTYQDVRNRNKSSRGTVPKVVSDPQNKTVSKKSGSKRRKPKRSPGVIPEGGLLAAFENASTDDSTMYEIFKERGFIKPLQDPTDPDV